MHEAYSLLMGRGTNTTVQHSSLSGMTRAQHQVMRQAAETQAESLARSVDDGDARRRRKVLRDEARKQALLGGAFPDQLRSVTVQQAEVLAALSVLEQSDEAQASSRKGFSFPDILNGDVIQGTMSQASVIGVLQSLERAGLVACGQYTLMPRAHWYLTDTGRALI